MVLIIRGLTLLAACVVFSDICIYLSSSRRENLNVDPVCIPCQLGIRPNSNRESEINANRASYVIINIIVQDLQFLKIQYKESSLSSFYRMTRLCCFVSFEIPIISRLYLII